MEIADAFRPYWAHGINNIISQKSLPLSTWLLAGNDYQIYDQITPTTFNISVYDRNLFLVPITFDCNRFSSSAFETLIKFEENAILPRSSSWLIVKNYYSAFYAAHYILRIIGKSLTQLDKNVTNKISKIADLYNYKNSIEIEKGFYLADYSNKNNTLHFEKQTKTGEDGSHGILWFIFSQTLLKISNEILNTTSSTEVQSISIKLSECYANLTYNGHHNGSWLSSIRNMINYKHSHGIWFPYLNQEKYCQELLKYSDEWKKSSSTIELKKHYGKELIRFMCTCQFIISIAREISVDMSKRCSVGKSFQLNGPIGLLNQSNIKLITKIAQ
jgi:hypothetical protein